MKKTEDDDTFELECSGRKFYANNGIIGIDPELDVSEGYDGSLSTGPEFADGELPDGTRPAWTQEEKAELAREMIKRWQKFGGLDDRFELPP